MILYILASAGVLAALVFSGVALWMTWVISGPKKKKTHQQIIQEWFDAGGWICPSCGSSGVGLHGCMTCGWPKEAEGLR